MADLLGGLEKIVKLARSINRAVKTVRRNKEECQRIERQVSRISVILKQLEVVNAPTMSGVLEDLSETLDRALTLVTDCQERRNVIQDLCIAGDMAMLLRGVREDISDNMEIVSFAINAFNIGQSRVLRRPSPEVLRRLSLSSLLPSAVPEGGAMGHEAPSYELTSSSLPASDWDAVSLAQPSSARRGGAKRRRASFSSASFSSARVKRRMKKRRSFFVGCTEFSLSELEAATRNFSEKLVDFSEKNLVGRVASIAVYKGVLPDEREVLIKKIRCHDTEEICDKIRFVSELKHKNIVQLLGFGYTEQDLSEIVGGSNVDNDYVFLVEEYMANGSLDNIIYGSEHDWSSRLRLIQGIAHGLHYLHEQQIVHLDLKPNNILVDSDINLKITNFGRAKKLHRGDEDVTDSGIDNILPDTMGYMPPEYIMEGIVSMMYDVYSFGVILLETISGMCTSEPTRHQASIEWAWMAREGGRMEELLVDLPLCSESQKKEVARCLEVGLLCTQSDQADRPTMLDVVEMLECKKELSTPKQPKYIKIPRN